MTYKIFTEHLQDSIVKVCNISQLKSISKDSQAQNFLNAPRNIIVIINLSPFHPN